MCIKRLKSMFIYGIFQKYVPSVKKIGYRTHSVKCPSDGYPMAIRWPSDVIWCERPIIYISLSFTRLWPW